MNHHINFINNFQQALLIRKYLVVFYSHIFWKFNFPMNPHVNLLVGWSVETKKGKLNFHTTIGALFFYINFVLANKKKWFKIQKLNNNRVA